MPSKGAKRGKATPMPTKADKKAPVEDSPQKVEAGDSAPEVVKPVLEAVKPVPELVKQAPEAIEEPAKKGRTKTGKKPETNGANGVSKPEAAEPVPEPVPEVVKAAPEAAEASEEPPVKKGRTKAGKKTEANGVSKPEAVAPAPEEVKPAPEAAEATPEATEEPATKRGRKKAVPEAKPAPEAAKPEAVEAAPEASEEPAAKKGRKKAVPEAKPAPEAAEAAPEASEEPASKRGRKKAVPEAKPAPEASEEPASKRGRKKAAPEAEVAKPEAAEAAPEASEEPAAKKGRKKAVPEAKPVPEAAKPEAVPEASDEPAAKKGRKKAATKSEDTAVSKPEAAEPSPEPTPEPVPEVAPEVASEASEDISDASPEPVKKGRKKAATKTEDTDVSAAKKSKAADKVEEKSKLRKAASLTAGMDFSHECKTKDGRTYNMKIASWNVNGIRAWMDKGGLSYITDENPDILCVQETKCALADMPEDVKVEGYHCYWSSAEQAGYAGTGIYSKIKPINVTYGLGIEKHDSEGRVITAEYEKFFLVTSYVPNSGRGLPRLPYRSTEWDVDFREYLDKLNKTKPVVMCGDLNVAHSEIDLTNPKTNKKTAGFTEKERQGFTDLLGAGYVDSFRELYPEQAGAYTFWTYMGNARAKNVGWRLDYFVLSERLKEDLCDQVIRKDVMGSDHCPIVLYMAFK